MSKRFVVTLVVGAQPAIGMILAGIDIFTRGPNMGFAYLASLVFALLCWTCPIWRK